MIKDIYCPACYPNKPSEECIDALKRGGILKVHWECWSACNLNCSFCYRTRETPINTSIAHLLLRTIKTGGASQVVFAGGDPSIRPDISDIVSFAKSLDLKVEIQTNSHYINTSFLSTLRTIDLLGLSLDGPNSAIHDNFRNKPGNFNQVINLLSETNYSQIPVVVRTVVSQQNYQYITDIVNIINRFPNILRWSLLEFSPIELGYINQGMHNIDREEFDKVASEIQNIYRGPTKIDIYRNENKIGTYLLITSSGNIYGTNMTPKDGKVSTLANINKIHIKDISKILPFSPTNHVQRYSNLINK